MNRLVEKRERLGRRIQRVRFAVKSRHPRPRLVFKRSNRFLWAQLVDDQKGSTICAASTREKSFEGDSKKTKEAATKLGQVLAQRALEKGVKAVVLDRRGGQYHGRIKAFADSARESGLEF